MRVVYRANALVYVLDKKKTLGLSFSRVRKTLLCRHDIPVRRGRGRQTAADKVDQDPTRKSPRGAVRLGGRHVLQVLYLLNLVLDFALDRWRWNMDSGVVSQENLLRVSSAFSQQSRATKKLYLDALEAFLCFTSATHCQLPTVHAPAGDSVGVAHRWYLPFPPHTSRHTNTHRSLGGRPHSCLRGLEHVLDRDMVVDTTLVGTVLNGLVQASGGRP